MNPLHPKKLLLTKWTAVKPLGRDKHFLVAKVVLPDEPGAAIEWVELEAVMSKAARRGASPGVNCGMRRGGGRAGYEPCP